MGPSYAALDFISQYPGADFIKVVLYGSLAKTGRGHMTDAILLETFGDRACEIVFDMETSTPVHPNTMDFEAFRGEERVAAQRYYSIGGGEVIADGEAETEHESVYPLSTFTEISN